MNVEIEGCGYIGMAEYHADSLIVALAFDATGSESMAQSMPYMMTIHHKTTIPSLDIIFSIIKLFVFVVF